MNDAPKEYIAKAIRNEAAVVANAQTSTRNQILNRSAFNLGNIPGRQLNTVVAAVWRPPDANGYLAEHGDHATRKVIESGFQTVSAINEKFLVSIEQNVAAWRLKKSRQLTSAHRR